VVGAWPVHLLATGAAGEGVVGGCGAGLQPIDDGSFGDRCQRPTAARAAAERGHGVEQVEAAHDFQRLAVGMVGAQQLAVDHVGAHQQPAVAGEQRPLIGGGRRGQLGVAGVVAVGGVQPQQPQPVGERAEMHVEQEAGFG